jgi:hypothetical protein
MLMERLKRESPHINGFPVSPHELSLPRSVLDPTKQENWNNHHICWTARRMGQFAITQTWRDLAPNQFPLLKDTHAVYHAIYEPSPLPDITDVMDVLYDAYQDQTPLRYGSAALPRYNVITPELWDTLSAEYSRLK